MKEYQTKLMERYLSNLRLSCNLIDKIIPVVNSFNGKVYNARFERKIKEVLPEGIFAKVDLDYCHCRINFTFWNDYREVFTEEFYSYENPSIDKPHRQVHYLPSNLEDVTICNIYSEYNNWDMSKNDKFHSKNDSYFWIDEYSFNTRLNTDSIIEELKKQKENIIKKADSLEYACTIQEGFTASMVEDWQKEVKELQDRASALYSAIPSVIKSIFEIKCYATWQ